MSVSTAVSSSTSVAKVPMLPKSAAAAQDRRAKEITALSGGLLYVKFEDGAIRDDEKASSGHQFYFYFEGKRASKMQVDEMWADDRDGGLPRAVAAELRRVAAIYLEVAKKIVSRKSKSRR